MVTLTSSFTPHDETLNHIHPQLLRLWMVRGVRMLTQEQRREILTSTSEPYSIVRSTLEIANTATNGAQTNVDDMLAALLEDLPPQSELEQGVLFDNLRLLGRKIGLTLVETRLLAFRTVYRLDAGLEALMDKMFHDWTDVSHQRRMANILGETEAAVERALSSNSVLSKTRLLEARSPVTGGLHNKTRLMPGLINILTRSHRSIHSLMKSLLSTVSEGGLSIADYPHLSKPIQLTRAYLHMSAQKRCKGVHVLLHGAPGTGKTELAKAFCKDLGWKLYGLNSDTGELDSNDGATRLGALAMAQHLLSSGKRRAILFDEIDDVIFAGIQDEKPLLTKQFLNRFLEEAPVPVFWITNHPEKLDPAYLRRFDICIEVTNPPRSVKRELLRQVSIGFEAPASWIEQQAGISQLNPALITRMANVASRAVTASAKSHATDIEFTDSFGLLRDQHFRALGRRADVGADCPLLDYNPAAINATLDPIALAAQLRTVGSARLLFHGVPGSGKTAYARALAKEIDRPLLPRQASDLLSRYLGETEQNIREVFEHATREDGVLLIDEVDSFLQSRERAVRSWEITQVNEFLTQLERFEGIVVCTTNFIDNLDAAAMRRFDAKVEFRALRQDQRTHLFAQLCRQMGTDDANASPGVSEELARLDTLTPGDFATVARLMRLTPLRSPAGVLAALADEQRHKPRFQGRGMGFVR